MCDVFVIQQPSLIDKRQNIEKSYDLQKNCDPCVLNIHVKKKERPY